MVIFAKKTIVGWEEWLSLPDLGLPLIKAKVDTGAQTSCLHATNIKVVVRQGKRYVKFRINPIHKNKALKVHCIAPLVDRRYIVDSGGHREKRYVIETTMVLGKKSYNIEITLTNRKTMAFRMLLGRQAMGVAKIMVDPVKSCCMGKFKLEEVIHTYEQIKAEKLGEELGHETKASPQTTQNENSDSGFEPRTVLAHTAD